jgi:hypothetical protein
VFLFQIPKVGRHYIITLIPGPRRKQNSPNNFREKIVKENEVPAGYHLCSVTGFLESNDGTGIQPKHKTAFLKHFKKSGDKTKAIETQGYRYMDLEWHLQNDTTFKREYRETLLAMKHELESIQFEHAMKANGHRDRQLWLETNFPEDYGKKSLPKGQKNKSKLDTLLDDLA